MTFNEFCRQHEANMRERVALWEYLAFVRLRHALANMPKLYEK